MPPKKSTNNPPKPIEPEIIVQNPPESPEAISIEGKNLMDVVAPEPNDPFEEAENNLYGVLVTLQAAHDEAGKTRAAVVTMDKKRFAEMAIKTQNAWELIQEARRVYGEARRTFEESPILKSLDRIEASIAGLEQKYEDIQAKVTENNSETARKLNEIQATTTQVKNHHEAIERTATTRPKSYADITQVSITNTKEKAITEMRARQSQQHNVYRQERAKYEVTLTTRQTTDEVKELINTMPPKEITERCQQAVEKASIPGVKLQGINKLTNGIRVHCRTEKQAEQLRAINWNEAFEGIKIREPNYRIVVKGMPTDDLDLDDPQVTKLLEEANDFPSGTITKVTPLLRKDKDPSNKTKHRSIIIDLKNIHTANKCITNGCYINYVHYMPQRFAPQSQITQCFNCCEYGHRAANCNRKPRCGKCGGKHCTKECNSATVQCVHCQDSHEAWRHECPAWIAEKQRLEKLRDHSLNIFTV